MATRAPERGSLVRPPAAPAGCLPRVRVGGPDPSYFAVGDSLRAYKPVPCFWTTGGWGVFLHTSSRVTAWSRCSYSSAEEVLQVVEEMRSGWAGAQRYPVHWGGDVPAAWELMLPRRPGHLAARRPVPVRPLGPGRAAVGAGRAPAGVPFGGTWTDWWTRERVRGPRWVPAEHGLGTMPLYLREGAVIPMGPVTHRVEVDGHPGEIVLDAPAGVELAP